MSMQILENQHIVYELKTTTAVGGTVTEFVVGEDGVLSWSPPVPPNGVILYYNVIISSSPHVGELVARIDELNDTSIDLYQCCGDVGGTFNIEV